MEQDRPEPIEVTVGATDYFSAEMRAKAVHEFGSNGAWLLLSQLWYGWRTHYDLACALVAGGRPEKGGDNRPDDLGNEFEIVRDLQIQAMLYAAAEQFATLLGAVREHRSGTEDFFEAFVLAPPNFNDLIARVGGLDLEELKRLLGNPRAPLASKSPGPDGPVDLSPASVPVTEVSGILIPTSVFEHAAEAGLREHAEDVLQLVITNAAQLDQFIVAPPPVAGATPQPLRAVDNSFRHGLRALFHQAVPEDRHFRVAGGEEAGQSEFAVDLYLPVRSSKVSEPVNFATVICTPDRTREHLDALRELCIRTGQVARAFLGQQTTGAPDMLLAAAALELPPVPSVASE